MFRQTYLEVDCEKLTNNVKNIIQNYPDYSYYFGVVKGNAYGHGSYIINSLIDGGVNYLAVSSLEEAIKSREFNSIIPILVLEPINLKYIETAVKNGITVTISNIDYFKELLKLTLSSKLKFHIKLDTGMSRLGLTNSSDFNEIVNTYHTNSNLVLEGLFSHFATSGINDTRWDEQVKKFKEITKDADLSKIPIVHFNRSLSLVNHAKLPFCNGTRLGISMYGMAQSMPAPCGLKGKLRELINSYKRKKLHISATTTTNNLKLNTAITLYSEIIDIRQIHKGNFVGYGASFIADEDMYIATIPIGYADGIPKKIKHVAINGKLYNVVGSICMDMICVKVDASVKLNDRVTLIGGELLPVKKVANECGINTYSLFTNITTRVPRVYIDNEKRVEMQY